LYTPNYDISSNILDPWSRQRPTLVNGEIKNWINNFCTILINKRIFKLTIRTQCTKCSKYINAQS
jgi:hypothetical protein